MIENDFKLARQYVYRCKILYLYIKLIRYHLCYPPWFANLRDESDKVHHPKES